MFKRFFTAWRYCQLDPDDYKQCLKKEFPNNLVGLWCVGLWYFIFMLINGILASICSFFVIALGMIFFLVYVQHLRRKITNEKPVSPVLIAILIAILYIAIISTGLYEGVLHNPDAIAVLFMIFLMCGIVLVIVSPVVSLLMTFTSTAIFISLSILLKSPQIWINDIAKVSATAPAAIVFNWFMTTYRLRAVSENIQLEIERNRYLSQSIIDQLTGLYNRRDFDERFQRYLNSPRKEDNFLCFAIMDIDFFKQYNDHYGHPQGDACLKAVGKVLSEKWENSSVYAARIGGEEFALLWFEKEEGNAQQVILELQNRVRHIAMPHAKSSVSDYVTISIGLCIVASSVQGLKQGDIYSAADGALYEAKKAGRNRAVTVLKLNCYITTA